MRHTSAVGIIVVCAVMALAAALLAGGHLTAIDSVPFRIAILLGAALFCQIAGVLLGYVGLPAGPTYAVACLVSAVLLGIVIRIDGGVPGAELLAAGLLLNALVMALYGNMPVSRYAVERAGAPASVATAQRHEPATSATRLRLFAEVIPVPLPLRPEVASVGDLLIAAGLAHLVFGALRPYGRREQQAAGAAMPARELSHSD